MTGNGETGVPGSTMARIEKEQFRNMSGGYIGAVVIGPKGDEKGIPVEPDATIWLSEEEQILTANAPRLPEHNPFIPWTRVVLNDDTGQWEDVEFTPLVKIEEARPVPANFRPIPGDISDAAATAHAAEAAKGAEPTVPTVLEAGAMQRHAEVAAMGKGTRPHDQPPVPRRAAMAAAMEEQESGPTAPPEPFADPVPPGGQPEEPATQPAAEETAAKVDPATGEETGAAVTPDAEAPQGEYAAHEEVGTPDAPAQQPPKPFTPGDKG